MINSFFQTNHRCDILKHISDHENWFNWSFDNDKAYFRVESNDGLCLVSRIIEYDFDITTRTLSNPRPFQYTKVAPNHQIISYEDPRCHNGNVSHVRVYRNKDNGLIDDIKICINNKEFPNTWEKNWCFYNEHEYIYSICPFRHFCDDKIRSLNYQMPEWENFSSKDERSGLSFSISTNIFNVDDSEFILFHTKRLDETKTVNYYQGVIQLKNKTPYSYSVEPLFHPSKQDVKLEYYSQLKNFRYIPDTDYSKYNVFYATSARCIDRLIYIGGGLGECQSVLYTINKTDFLIWYNDNVKIIK